MDLDLILDGIVKDRFTAEELRGILAKCREIDHLATYKIKRYHQPLSVKLWLEYEEPVIKGRKVYDVYEQYLKWCRWYNVASESQIKFSKTIMTMFNVVSKVTYIDGKSYRCYI